MNNEVGTIVIVRNLPEVWRTETLISYIRLITRWSVLGIKVFRNITHTVLLFVKECLTASYIGCALQDMVKSPFEKIHVFSMKVVSKDTKTVLIQYPGCQFSRDHLFYFFDNIAAVSEEKDSCHVFPKLFMAVITFEKMSDAMHVIAKGSHSIKSGARPANVDPWYEEFHRPLLDDLLQKNSLYPKKHTVLKVDIPQLHMSFVEEFKHQGNECKLIVHKEKGCVELYGPEGDCLSTKHLLDVFLTNFTAHQCIQLSTCMARLLSFKDGNEQFTLLTNGHKRCFVKIHGFEMHCFASESGLINDFVQEYKANTKCANYKISQYLSMCPIFLLLQTDVEKDHMVVMAVQHQDGNQDSTVCIEGFAKNVDLVDKSIQAFISRNKLEEHEVHMIGNLKYEACMKWFSNELETMKHLIVKNGDIVSECKSNGYALKYRCPQHVLPSITEKFNDMENAIKTTVIDFKKIFTNKLDLALVANGINAVGTKVFLSHLDTSFKTNNIDCLCHIDPLDKCIIPKFMSSSTKCKSRQHSERKFFNRPRHQSPPMKYASSISYPYVTSIGTTTVTVKIGDITVEKADCAINLLGKDIKIKNTSIGKAFLAKCPALDQYISQLSNSARGTSLVQGNTDMRKDISFPLFLQKSDGKVVNGRLLVTPLQYPDQLSVTQIIHAVIRRTYRMHVLEAVKALVLECLKYCVNAGLKSVVIPPIGVGKRFQYGPSEAASGMVSAINGFLNSNPFRFQSITIVVYNSTSVADKFVLALKSITGEGFAQKGITLHDEEIQSNDSSDMSHGSESDDDDDDDDYDDEADEDPCVDVGSPHQKLEVLIVTRGRSNNALIMDLFKKEMTYRFLWKESLDEQGLPQFTQLPQQVIEKFSMIAQEKSIVMEYSADIGLTLCGQKENVQEMIASIQKRLAQQLQADLMPSNEKRQSCGLPVNTDRFPTYWNLCKNSSNKSNLRMNSNWKESDKKIIDVSKKEVDDIKKLVLGLWNTTSAPVGAGRDAIGLSHQTIQITKIQRLENPRLFVEYSHQREKLFDRLTEDIYSSKRHRCTPVNQLANTRYMSSGPVKTTEIIAKKSLLSCDIYPQEINEHYLFHGTKTDSLKKIYSEGLDFRLNKKSMFGKGTYFSENPIKADQYTDFKDGRTVPNTELVMLMVRTLLGEPYLHTSQSGVDFSRPPCVTCASDNCACMDSAPSYCDSVIDNSARLHREFVVYERSVCYPEYIISYKRV